MNLTNASAFRHDPRKSVLARGAGHSGPYRWDIEPALCGYRQFRHTPAGKPPVAVPVCASPVAVTGVGPVFATYDGRVRLYDCLLEKTFWEHRVDSPVYASLTVDAKRQQILVAATSGLVEALDLRGRTVWSVRVDGPIYATPTILPIADVLVVAAFTSRCVGLRLDTGAEVFSRAMPVPWHTEHRGSAAHRDPYASPVVLDTGDVAVGCAEHIVCLTPDGDERWRRDIGASVRSSPVSIQREATVAVAAVNGRCTFLDIRTGAERGSVDLGGKVTGSPALSGPMLAIGTQHGVAFGIDVREHTIRWQTPGYAPRDHTSVTVTPGGEFVMTTTRGNAVGLDRDDGRFLWETSQLLGLADHDPTLDTTPVVATDGNMYCGSYSGVGYRFRFRPGQGAS